ncbi:hypothetical protein HK096_006952, partial [Nowakowskiella sp. JEL0078]
MSVSTVSIVLILKKDDEDENFMLESEFPSTFATFCENVSLKIEKDLPRGCTFTLKYKKKVENQTFRLCDDGDVKRVLSEPSSFEILAFPTKSPENIFLPHHLSFATPVDFNCK